MISWAAENLIPCKFLEDPSKIDWLYIWNLESDPIVSASFPESYDLYQVSTKSVSIWQPLAKKLISHSLLTFLHKNPGWHIWYPGNFEPPHFHQVRSKCEVRTRLVHTSYLSRIPRIYPCKFFLAGVNFYKFNAKNWQFTVYFAVITHKTGNFLCNELTPSK